jgi:hypothetical protein
VEEQSTHRTQGWVRVTQALDRVRQAARQRRKEKLTALFHHLSVDLVREAFFALKRDAAPGVDGLTWETYEADLERNLTDLHSRVQWGAYRALPSRRAYKTAPAGGCGARGQDRPKSDRCHVAFNLTVDLQHAAADDLQPLANDPKIVPDHRLLAT